jgi:hypothetical protein
MMNENIYYVISFSVSWHRLLRRTLVLPVSMASAENSLFSSFSLLPFRGWGQIRLA